jgi:hypothetical protein
MTKPENRRAVATNPAFVPSVPTSSHAGAKMLDVLAVVELLKRSVQREMGMKFERTVELVTQTLSPRTAAHLACSMIPAMPDPLAIATEAKARGFTGMKGGERGQGVTRLVIRRIAKIALFRLSLFARCTGNLHFARVVATSSISWRRDARGLGSGAAGVGPVPLSRVAPRSWRGFARIWTRTRRAACSGCPPARPRRTSSRRIETRR